MRAVLEFEESSEAKESEGVCVYRDWEYMVGGSGICEDVRLCFGFPDSSPDGVGSGDVVLLRLAGAANMSANEVQLK